jgi:hypothetical protein
MPFLVRPPVLAGSLLGLIIAAAASPANALTVTVGGNNYNVISRSTSYSTDPSLFDRLAAGGRMPWWGDQAMASEFAAQVGSNLGEGSDSGFGLYFAYESNGAPAFDLSALEEALANPGVQAVANPGWNQTARYAVLSDVPGPLPIFAAAAAFHRSRQLRRRMKG